MQEQRALVVEDDPDISSVLVTTLEGAGFEVSTAVDGREAIEMAASVRPDLVTLDLTLPLMDGIEVCRHIREVSDCYIVIVSARADEIDRLIGLEVGADDYVLKPFSPRELRARVAALFRRPRTGQPQPAQSAAGPTGAGSAADTSALIDCGDGLVIHPARREVVINGDVVELTRIEFDVLAHLATRLSRVCTREAMVLDIWSSELAHDTHLVDVHVANLRAKLRRHSPTKWIHTIRGIGYRLDPVGSSGATPLRDKGDPDWAAGLS